MSLFSFDVVPKSLLGIDIGNSSLKVTEISGWGERRTLKNYGEIRVRTLYDEPFRTFDKNALLLSSNDISKALKAIFEETHIKERRAIFSISDFSSFFTSFQLPPMKDKELADAVRFEARRHVPLSLSEVVLDWQLVEKRKEKNQPHNVLLVAVPKEVISQYEEIARYSGLKLVALEAEVFGSIRSSLQDEKEPVVLLDIGSQTTTVSVVYNGILWISYSTDTGGNSFTERIAKGLSINYLQAEQEKIAKGIHVAAGNVQILLPVVDLLLTEIRKAMEGFHPHDKKQVRKIVLGGGAGSLLGLPEYIEKHIDKKTELIHPFRHILYPPILEDAMKEMGPSYAVAVGMGLRGFE